MHRSSPFLVLALAAALLAGASCASAQNIADSLRVLWIKPADFDYTLITYVQGPSGAYTLSVRQRGGRTYFVSVGDRLGEYEVKSFTPLTERVFSSSLNAYEERKSGRMTVVAPGGEVVELAMGRSTPRPGWMACVVSTDTLEVWPVREANTLVFRDVQIPVRSITRDRVTVDLAGAAMDLPALAAGEQEQLAQKWRERAKRLEDERRLAEETARAQDSTVPASTPVSSAFGGTRVLVDSTSKAQVGVGTDYRYPIEYQVLPGIWSPSGKLISAPVAVPVRFGIRRTTFGLSTE